MSILKRVCLTALSLAAVSVVHIEAASNDWATNHMQGMYAVAPTRPQQLARKLTHIAEEHHIGNFDAPSFFQLHDYDGSGAWTANEVRQTYGMDDSSNRGRLENDKQAGVRAVFALFDPGATGVITRDDFVRGIRAGKRLPDLGFGPGHHGDIEYEYEIHHFEKYHAGGATEEELNHKEDLDHFEEHDRMEDQQIALAQLESMAIVEANIPAKFMRRG